MGSTTSSSGRCWASKYEGEFAAIVGPSGSGKSTLLGLIGLLDQPTTGTVVVGGVDRSRAGDRARTHQWARALGFVFQRFHLVPHLDAAANVETALLYRRLGRRRRRASAFEALDRAARAGRIINTRDGEVVDDAVAP